MRPTHFVYAVLLLLAAGRVDDAPAEVVADASQLVRGSPTRAYLFSRPRLETMVKAAREQDVALKLQVDCAEQILVKPLSIRVLAPIDLPDGRSHPVAGTWSVHYDVSRCGAVKAYNVILTADPAGAAPRLLMTFPGTTLASPRLLRDAMVTAVSGAMARAGRGDCRNPVMRDMEVTEPPHTVTEGSQSFEKVWNETWTFDVCGQDVEDLMRFVPTPRDGGTDFHVTTRLPPAPP